MALVGGRLAVVAAVTGEREAALLAAVRRPACTEQDALDAVAGDLTARARVQQAAAQGEDRSTGGQHRAVDTGR